MKLLGNIALGLSLFAAVLAAAALDKDPASAHNLPFHQCLQLKSEKSRLVSQGVNANLQKGPDWAKKNLTTDKISKVKRLIEVSELLEFRCDMRGVRSFQKRMKQPKFAKWKALKPPLPSRNPKFIAAAHSK